MGVYAKNYLMLMSTQSLTEEMFSLFIFVDNIFVPNVCNNETFNLKAIIFGKGDHLHLYLMKPLYIY